MGDWGQAEDPGARPHSILGSFFCTVSRVLDSTRESAFQVRSGVAAWRRCLLKDGKDCDGKKRRAENVLGGEGGISTQQ